jgi:gliding motility-associated-like protein
VAGRHTIISSLTGGIDPYGNFSQLCPNGSAYSVKLGNTSTGAQAEGISYTYTIPPLTNSFSILYHYAVVFQNPGHSPEEQPRFRARIIDLSTNNPIPCVSFDFTSSGSLPGFRPSPIDPNVLYKDWTPVSINLSGYAGKTIMIEFITSDCTRGGHFGYAYMDVNSFCNGVISGNFICPGDTAITLNAPFGFQTYAWYSDNTFSTIISNTQSLYLNPLPTVGSIFPVIVTPYFGFGCVDTLYATITVGNKPVADAGPDQSLCQQQLGQIGAPPNPIYAYEWTPPGQVSNPFISNPMAWAITANPEMFIVKTTDALTGCAAFDTTYISTQLVDTSIILNGRNDFCIGELTGGTLSVSSLSSIVQWHNNSGPIPGGTAYTYKPLASGDYWAEVTQFGCVDSTSRINFNVHPLPIAAFTASSDTGCVTNNNFLFTNTTTVADAAPMTFLWKFSDGIIMNSTDANRTFLLTGNFIAKLVATTASGCKDSTIHTVHVMPNGVVNFLWDSICTGRPVQFQNLSNEKGSPQVNYNWTFNNGGPGSVLKNPLPVVYSVPAQVNVTLKLTALGCENYADSVTKKVQVNIQKPGVTYRTITVPQGSSQFIHVRDTIGTIYNWRPQMQLSSYNTRYTEFFAAGNDVQYLIDISDIHTCVTTDSMLMLVLKKPGFYLPTAFTPNGDGLNDEVQPYLIGMKGLKSFSVFNRWGNLVFYTTKYGETWKGKYQGVVQDPGVYVWILEFFNSNNKKVMEKGTITLIR